MYRNINVIRTYFDKYVRITLFIQAFNIVLVLNKA